MEFLDHNEPLSPHFRRREFLCPCGCGAARAHPDLICVLEHIRTAFGPVIIHHAVAGAYRCPTTVRRMVLAGRCKSTTQHATGRAADFHITCRRDEPSLEAICDIALAMGARGVGIYPRDKHMGWLHIDVRELSEGEKPRTWKG